MRQKGFTLLELLVALAIGSMLTTGVVLSIQQVLVGTDRSNSQVVALTDIDYAVLAIKKDLMMTQSTNLTDGSPIPQSSVMLSWIDYTSSFDSGNQSVHSSSYTLSANYTITLGSGTFKKTIFRRDLRRNYDGVEGIVGRNITSIGFTQNGTAITVVITAIGPGIRARSETLKFSAHIRAEELE